MAEINRETIQQYDAQNMLGSIEVLQEQCKEAWEQTSEMELPGMQNIDRIAFFGMGGSALGASVLKHLFADSLTVPIDIINDYHIPGFVNENTLAVLSSYSGTTEEVVEVSKNIGSKTSNVVVITTGGDLEVFAQSSGHPAYIYSPTYNPSNQPRMAIGYSVMAAIGIMTAAGLLEVTQEQVDQVVQTITDLHGIFGPEADIEENRAKAAAMHLVDKFPIFVSSEFLYGGAHVLANQVNENGKHIAARFAIPELNHHLMEAFSFPETSLENVVFCLFESQLYYQRNQLRYSVTTDVLVENGLDVLNLPLTTGTKLEQVFELILFGEYLSIYLATLHEIDPSPIPNVSSFKKMLV